MADEIVLQQADSVGSISFDEKTQTLEVEVDGTFYVFKPKYEEDAFDLYTAVTRIASYSTSRAIAYLKKNATGLRAEAIDPLVNEFLVQAGFSIDPLFICVIEDDDSGEDLEESIPVSDYFEFRERCTQASPRAREVKDSETGFVMFIDPKDNKVIGRWNSSEGRGEVINPLEEADSFDDFDKWVDDMSKDGEDLTLSISQSDMDDQDKFLIAQDKEGDIVGSAAIDDRGKLNAKATS
jgi:hypothetical protein